MSEPTFKQDQLRALREARQKGARLSPGQRSIPVPGTKAVPGTKNDIEALQAEIAMLKRQLAKAHNASVEKVMEPTSTKCPVCEARRQAETAKKRKARDAKRAAVVRD